MALPINSLAWGLEKISDDIYNIGNGIGNVINYLNPLSENFFMREGLNRLNPLHEDFFLAPALVPADGFLQSKFDEIYTLLGEKLPLINDIQTISETVVEAFNQGSNSIPPEFTFTLPAKYGGGQAKLIDFQFYPQFKGYIDGFIIMTSYFFFFRKLLKTLPKYIYI